MDDEMPVDCLIGNDPLRISFNLGLGTYRCIPLSRMHNACVEFYKVSEFFRNLSYLNFFKMRQLRKYIG
jgi:hypothetical protein